MNEGAVRVEPAAGIGERLAEGDEVGVLDAVDPEVDRAPHRVEAPLARRAVAADHVDLRRNGRLREMIEDELEALHEAFVDLLDPGGEIFLLRLAFAALADTSAIGAAGFAASPGRTRIDIASTACGKTLPSHLVSGKVSSSVPRETFTGAWRHGAFTCFSWRGAWAGRERSSGTSVWARTRTMGVRRGSTACGFGSTAVSLVTFVTLVVRVSRARGSSSSRRARRAAWWSRRRASGAASRTAWGGVFALARSVDHLDVVSVREGRLVPLVAPLARGGLVELPRPHDAHRASSPCGPPRSCGGARARGTVARRSSSSTMLNRTLRRPVPRRERAATRAPRQPPRDVLRTRARPSAAFGSSSKRKRKGSPHARTPSPTCPHLGQETGIDFSARSHASSHAPPDRTVDPRPNSRETSPG